MPPWKETFSSKSRYAVNIRNIGVSARKGIVRLMGEIFKAFMYKIMAITSKGRAIKVADQKVLSRWGISINARLTKRTGNVNISLIHATKYSSLETSARLVKASLVANRKAAKRA
ncbi:MAG: hypothetical protein L0956_00465 [Candidatus Mariimomonas ferrooxydans]